MFRSDILIYIEHSLCKGSGRRTMKPDTIKIIIAGTLGTLAVAYFVLDCITRKTRATRTAHRRLLMQLLNFAIIVVCATELIEVFDPTLDIKSTVLTGSALIVAILGFAAQPVIADIICGVLISIHKPFEIGDRVIVEGQTAGTVEDITLRHTVIKGRDNMRLIIPNSVMNSKVVTNTSYRMADRRGIDMSFSVSYDTDVRKAIEIVRDCVAASPYTLSVDNCGLTEDSGPVYFTTFGDSALVLKTTIWVAKSTNGTLASSDVNIRVLEAFRQYGIEIPYPYFNVVQFTGEKETTPADFVGPVATGPSRRHRRSETVRMEPGKVLLEEAVNSAKAFAEVQNMTAKASMQIELLMEEAVSFVQRVAEQTGRDFWIEGTGVAYRIHICFRAQVGSDGYKKLLQVSSTGRNEASNSFSDRIWSAVFMGMKPPTARRRKNVKAGNFEWQLSDTGVSEEEIGKSVLGAVANDIRVSVTSEGVEIIIEKINK